MERLCQIEPDDLIFLAYNSMGAIYMSEKFSNLQKFIWFSFNLIVTCATIFGGIEYMVTSEAFLVWDLVQVIWGICGTIFVTIMLPLITQYYSNNFNTIFCFVQDRFVLWQQGDGKGGKKIFLGRCDTKAVGFFWISILMSLYIAYLCMAIIDILFISNDPDSYRTLYYHLMPIPYMRHISSIGLYFLLYFMECIIAICMTIVAASEVAFIAMIGSEFNNITVNLCEQMEFLTQRLSTQIEETQNFDCRAYQRASVSFEKSIKFFIQKYQTLIQTIHLLQSYVQFFDTIMMGCIVLIISCNIFVFLLLQWCNGALNEVELCYNLKIDMELFLKLKIVFISIMCIVELLVHCNFGTIFNDMTEAAVQQVYNLPWYNFSPNQRKTVYIFLNQVQRPITFKAFGLYSINLVTLPMILRVAYSWVNILVATLSQNH